MCDFVRWQADRLAAVDPHRPAAMADETEQRLEGGGSSGPVATQKSHNFTAIHIEIDAVQDVRLTVEGMQPSHPQHFVHHPWAPCSSASAVPMYASITSGFLDTSAYVPLAMMRPCCSTVMVSAIVATTFMLCSTIRTVRPVDALLMRPVTLSTSSCPMPCVGSSSSISSGSIASVVAISRARLRPYGSSTAATLACAPRPTASSNCSARGLRAARVASRFQK